MCQQCLDACNKYWPHLTPEQRRELLWEATCFPFGCGGMVAEQLRKLAEQSGGDLKKALAIADQQMEFVIRNNHRWIWPMQYEGVSDFELVM